MYLCYVDESGTPEVPGTTSHFVLAGLSVPIWRWRDADSEFSGVMASYGLGGQEFHTAWVLRKYLEQSRIPNFEKMDWNARRSAIERERAAHLLALQKTGRHKTFQQQKKTYAHTRPYIHLTHDERLSLTQTMADRVSGWGYARLFAECIDKIHFDEARAARLENRRSSKWFPVSNSTWRAAILLGRRTSDFSCTTTTKPSPRNTRS